MRRHLSALEERGYAVIEDALPPAQLERLTRAVDRVWETRCRERGALHELSFLGHDRAFLELLDQPLVLSLVSATLGWNVYVYHCHLDVHPPLRGEPEQRWRWHQDGGRQNVDVESPRPRLSVKAAYFLTDVATPEHGALWVLPGSHHDDRLARPSDGALRPPGAEPVLVRAGSAVLFDRRVWHARGDNTSLSTRKALFYAYTYRWIRLRDELSLESDIVESLDPLRRQLVGYGESATDYWMPGENLPLRALHARGARP
ncbi:MAG: phytanoyl-CoA dioxygenase family protein [Actinobacteria bacterium]|nr:phytanoyl-CoA dioxygenase family protein [Actinomycetota bacterium]